MGVYVLKSLNMPSLFLYLQSNSVGGSPRLITKILYMSFSILFLAVLISSSFFPAACISLKSNASSFNFSLINEDICLVFSLLCVSGMADCGTTPYFCTISANVVHCPPSPIGFLNSQSTVLSFKALSLVAIIPSRNKFDFSN